MPGAVIDSVNATKFSLLCLLHSNGDKTIDRWIYNKL